MKVFSKTNKSELNTDIFLLLNYNLCICIYQLWSYQEVKGIYFLFYLYLDLLFIYFLTDLDI